MYEAKSGVFQGGRCQVTHTHTYIRTHKRHGDRISRSAHETERLKKKESCPKCRSDGNDILTVKKCVKIK